MAVPDYQTLMLPVLHAAEHGEVRIGDVVLLLADKFALTPEERAELLPSGRQTVFSNRVHWAKTYLGKAGLLEPVRRGHFKITERGRSVLASAPTRIDNDFLSQFPEFREFRTRDVSEHKGEADEALEVARPSAAVKQTPDEIIRAAHAELDAGLAQELLERILAAPPDFFERLIITLLVSMGYGGTIAGAGRAVGRSGDDGVDGVVDQDALGLDRVYVQAKRYKPENKVGAPAIREFFGSLNLQKATKGLFVTTSTFSEAAQQTASSLGSRIVLVDGRQFAQLMIRYNVGCRVEETLHLKKLDEDFFE
jgi:restriction system protein